jgi:hypothetical protein
MQIFDENIVVTIGFLCIFYNIIVYLMFYDDCIFMLVPFFYIIVYLTFYDDIVFSQILRFFTLLYLCFMICNIVVFYFFQFCLSTMYFLDHYFYVCILSSKYSAVFLYAVRFLLGVIVFIFSFHF